MAKASSKAGQGKRPRRRSPRKQGISRSSSLVNEPGVQYGLQSKKSATVLRMTPNDTSGISLFAHRPEHILTSFEKMELLEKGVSKKDLESLKKSASLDYDKLAQVLNVARATLLSRKGREKFSSDLGDKIISLADLYSYGYEVFGQKNRFNNWVFVPNKALGGIAPFDIMHSSFGREEIKNLIGRIDYGVYS
jgi:putative toxin-antitoxin system antitoxin component (TIGR02293 family)